MVYSSSVSIFIANALNSIMRSAVFCFPCLKNSIFHLTSTIFVLSLNIVLISLTKSSQFWVPNSLSSSLSFLCVYILTIPPLKYARIAMILLSVFMTLLLLMNNLIPLYHFVQSPSNYLGSITILLSIIACIFSFAGIGTTDISLSDYLPVYSEALFVIFNDSSLSDSAFILFVLYELVLSSLWFIPYVFCLSSGGVMTLSLSSGCN